VELASPSPRTKRRISRWRSAVTLAARSGCYVTLACACRASHAGDAQRLGVVPPPLPPNARCVKAGRLSGIHPGREGFGNLVSTRAGPPIGPPCSPSGRHHLHQGGVAAGMPAVPLHRPAVIESGAGTGGSQEVFQHVDSRVEIVVTHVPAVKGSGKPDADCAHWLTGGRQRSQTLRTIPDGGEW